MDSSEIRQISVMGGKSADLIVKRRRTRRRGGGEEEMESADPVINTLNGPRINITKSNDVATATATANATASSVAVAATQASAPSVPVAIQKQESLIEKVLTPPPQPVPTATPQQQPQTGGKTQVILKPKERRTTKVLLKKKEKAPGIIQPKPKPIHKSKTRKLVLSSPTHRLSKTRHTIKHAKELPLDKLRHILIEKKLIKASSKAPEPILRQIYTDTLIVAKKTL